MKKFKLEDYKGKYAMHCDTEEKAKIFCKFLHDNGKHWRNGDSYAKCTEWEIFRGATCYEFNGDLIQPLGWCKQHEILKFDDFDWSDYGYTDNLFDWEAFKNEKIAVHCDTEEKANAFLKECEKHGMNWHVCKATEKNYWIEEKEKTCYAYNFFGDKIFNIKDKIGVSDLDHYKSQGYKIIECPFVNNFTNEKIIITHDNKTVTAKLYQDKKLIKSVESKCHSDDKFDFMTGARLAFDRLDSELPKQLYNGKVVCVNPNGSRLYIKGKIYEFKNGTAYISEDVLIKNVYSFKEFQECSHAEWLEIIE